MQFWFKAEFLFTQGFREFEPAKLTVVEGEAVAMQISCTTLRECSHDKISWYIKDEEIPFDPRDLHFRRESNHNFHRLWIDKACPSDEGTFSARKDEDEKQCELQVLGRFPFLQKRYTVQLIDKIRSIFCVFWLNCFYCCDFRP